MSQGCSCDCGHRCWEEASDAGPVDLSDRAIRPLPLKRLRTHAAPTQLPKSLSTTPTQPLTSADDVSSASGSDDDDAPRSARAVRPAARAKLAQSGETDRQHVRQGSQEHHDGAAQDRWQEDHVAPLPDHRLADEAHDGSTHTSNSHEQESSASESPPTSPASVSPRIKSEERASQGGSVLFGEEGRRIVDSLTTASSFSPAGLFGGLGLATLHPSLAPSGDRDFPDEEDILEGGDEDSYGVVDRSHPPVEPTIATQQAAMALVVGVGGSNKKKRKIPGVAETRDASHPSAEDAGSANAQAATPAVPVTNSLPSDPRELFAEKGLLAPLNPPRTAEAALAKWRIRPPHVSLCTTCYSSRRTRRKRFRRDEAKLPPVALPAAPAFVPPAQPREGPPRLPPGSGAKGSKAIKLAMKAAKEREKEKERIRTLFGQIRLPDLWDPQGTANPSPGFVTRSIKADLERKRRAIKDAGPTGLSAPPGTDGPATDERLPDLFLDASPPQLDLFTFFERPPEIIESRWTALNDQKIRLKAAKERAAKAREEEDRRRKEKEARDARDEDAPPLADAPVVGSAPTAPLAQPLTSSAVDPIPAPAPPDTTGASLSGAPAAASRPKQNRAQSSSDLPDVKAGPGGPPPSAPLPPTPKVAPAAPALTPPTAPTTRKTSTKKGKKKRSAHANALNVHHRDNYVPSRAPAPGQAAQDSPPRFMSWPASEEAIASAGPFASTCGGGHYCSADEWLCLFCEYELFYGEESLLYKAVRRRKNVLKVRKKAQDRANKATHASEPSAAPSSGATDHAHPHPAAPGEAAPEAKTSSSTTAPELAT